MKKLSWKILVIGNLAVWFHWVLLVTSYDSRFWEAFSFFIGCASIGLCAAYYAAARPWLHALLCGVTLALMLLAPPYEPGDSIFLLFVALLFGGLFAGALGAPFWPRKARRG